MFDQAPRRSRGVPATKLLISIVRKVLAEVVLVGAVSILVIVALQAIRRPTVLVRPGLSMRGPLVTVGSRVAMDSVQFSKRALTLLLVSSPYCHFCLASKDFHKQLFAEAEKHDVPVFLSVPDRSSSAAYTGDFHLPPERLKPWKDLSVSFEGTPTFVAINSSGVRTQLWIGELTPAQEKAVIDLVRSGIARSAKGVPPLEGVHDLSPELLERVKGTQTVDIIDIRERSDMGHLPPGIVNIPLQEIPFRVQDEVAAKTLHLVDCRAIAMELCDRGVQALEREGLRVGTIGRGTYHESWCRATRAGSPVGN